MNFSLAQILLLIVAYLTGLFTVAYLADKGFIAKRITHHPATYVLSLGVFAGALATNGIIELAYRYGYSFMLYYAGVVLMFVMATLLLVPLLRLCRVYQLASLADVLTFRFRSPWVGTAITVSMCLTLLPLLALQIQTVADSIHLLRGSAFELPANQNRQDGLALLFCAIIIVFSILFGTRHKPFQQRNTGLVTAIAFESLVKLTAMFVLMITAVYTVFNGPEGIDQWLGTHPQANMVAANVLTGDTNRALLLVFFAGAVCMPHIFHMTFAENNDSRDLQTAGWGLPMYLLLLSLPVLPVTWAGIKLGQELPVSYTGLGMGATLQSTPVSTAAFMAGLSSASATIIVTTLALAHMCLNHLILPTKLLPIDRERNIYVQLKWVRRALIGVLILAGYGLFIVLNGKQSLMQLGLVAFSGTAQFLPGIIATLYWNRANRKGLLTGLAAGLLLWFFSMLLPLAGAFDWLQPDNLLTHSDSQWATDTIVALVLNAGLLIVVSLLTRASAEEQVAAEICSMNELARPTRRALILRNAGEFSSHLAVALGEATAAGEVQRALQELQFTADENRPYALRRLRTRIEANLSGLLGPGVAHSIVERCLPYQPGEPANVEDITLIERNLDRPQMRLTGLAADLDKLRRHYREILDKLPIGVCSLADNGEVLMWNRSMEQITSIPPDRVLGYLLQSLPEPWHKLLTDFQHGNVDNIPRTEVAGDAGQCRWVSLHKTSAGDQIDGDGTVILVEDITHYELLAEELLHSERLASIGRLAAGVAHEIGNPVTGIACLAQNLEYDTDRSEVQDTAQDILRQTQRVSRIVESLVNFSHSGSASRDGQLGPANLADCVDEAIHLLTLDREAPVVKFINHCDREMVVLADSQRLLQVFINMLSNARDACGPGGLVTISASQDDNTARIDIDDDGCGIPPELQSQIFEPFFTTKEPGAGTGLGLALVFSIMEDMNGSISLTSPTGEPPGRGTRFSLCLPLTQYGTEFDL